MSKYCVYKHTSPSGKVYIGITSQNPIRRWKNGLGYKNQVFFNAIQKYGWENIKHEILFSGLSKEEAELKEIELIKSYRSTDFRFGYNFSDGGHCKSPVSFETREKISKNHADVSGSNNPMFGIYHSEETKRKISMKRKGIVVTEETKRKISDSTKGKKNHNFGKPMSIEAKIKMSNTKKGVENPKLRKKVFCVELNKIFNSLLEASKNTGANYSKISEVCNGNRKSTGGYHWQFC